LIKYSLVVEH